MKRRLLSIILVFIFSFPGCSKKVDENSDKSNKKEKGAVEETIDYATGKTPLYQGQKAKATVIQTMIATAVNQYELYEGKKPENLQQLVDANFLNSKYTKDEWGRDLIVQFQNGKLTVRSMGPDKKPDTADDWMKQF